MHSSLIQLMYSVSAETIISDAFHIVKMYKDKEVKKNVKNIFLSICDVQVFLTFTFTEYGTVLTTILPILFLYLNTVIVTAGAFEP